LNRTKGSQPEEENTVKSKRIDWTGAGEEIENDEETLEEGDIVD